MKNKMKTLNKRLLIAIIALMFIFFVSAFGFSLIERKAFGTGDGTNGNPYQISTASDLELMNDYPDASFILLNNINLSGTSFAGIAAEFNGTLDGNGFYIENYISERGLFEIVGESGVVKNLGLVNCNIAIDAIEGFVGGLANVNRGLIENCYVSGDVSNSYNSTSGASLSAGVGGLSGLNIGEINDSYNESTIFGRSYIGGVVGINGGVYNSQTYIGTIVNCYSTGGFSWSIAGNPTGGGIAGANDESGTISACFNAGNLHIGSVVGGIAGWNAGLISECFNSGDVNSAYISTAGGITAINETGKGVISNCYNTGSINHWGISKFSDSATIEYSYDTAKTVNSTGYGVSQSQVIIGVGTTFYNKDIYQGSEASGTSPLTTEEMTLDNTLNDVLLMGRLQNDDKWVKRANAESLYYYPELAVFYNSPNEVIREASKMSVEIDNIKGPMETLIVTMDNWTYGETPSEPLICEDGSYAYNGPQTIFYKLAGTADSTYTTEVPVNAGKYVMLVKRYNPVELYAYGKAEFEILKATLTVTADDKGKVYGENNPELTYTVDESGFKYGENVSVISGAFSLITQATAASDVGNYAISITAGTTQADNYEFEFVNGTLTIEKATISITGITGTAVYGETLEDVVLSGTDAYDGTFSWEQALTTAVGNAGEATAFTLKFRSTNYNDVDDIAVTITVAKAIPVYTVPTNIEAKVGQKLSEISLPEGFSWMDGTLDVGAAGNNSFKVKYTPSDEANYETVSNIEVSVKVTGVDSKGAGLSQGATIGIITGCIVLAVLGAVFMITFIIKRRKQKQI